METQQNSYKRTLAGSVGAGVGAIFNGGGRTYYILEHKTETAYHHAGESQKIIIDQIELGRAATCQVRFDESCETVSRRHAAIVKEGDKVKLIPLSQTNGTYVNGTLVQSEYYLNSGDEIKLSSNGPVIGFIQPQGAQSLVKSIGLTERMNLFRKQALRPYKIALITLSIVFLLAVGGLLAYNIYQDNIHQEQMAQMQSQVDQTKQEVADAQQALDDANAVVSKQQAEVLSLMANQNATQEQLQAAQARLEEAEANARSARSAASSASARLHNAEQQLRDLKDNRPVEVPVATTTVSGSATSQTVTTSSAVSSTTQTAATSGNADINSCLNNVYFIRMDNVTVYDHNNNIVVQFPCDNLVFGTGFMLDNGRFVTARRIARPWDYYINSDENLRRNLGRDAKGNYWKFEDVQICVNAGLKVEANYTAFSPVNNFKFSNADLTVDESKSGVQTFKFRGANGWVEDEVHVSHDEYNLNWYNTKPSVDWAVMLKRDQINSDAKGLKANAAYSTSPKGNTEVRMLGFPNKRGFSGSQSVHPQDAVNNINASGLNNGIVELASNRYQPGFDGAPVLIEYNGEWQVIGILGHTDGVARDNVTPIANLR